MPPPLPAPLVPGGTLSGVRAALRLGNYEPLLQLATGGMATVYVARQLGAAGFERLVVVKRVHRHLLENEQFHDMFVDEAKVASLVRHPNVVPVIDVVEVQGELFLVQEYVESSALSTLCKAAGSANTRIPTAVVVRIALDMLAGLHAAHEAVDMRGRPLHVVHRDVSPQNVVVGVDGTSRLIDFGVAKAAHRVTTTKSGSFKGKYGYMAPEQTRAADVDRRADVFAAGVVLHEALTLQRLFQGENDLDTMRRILEAPIPPPSSIVPDLPRALDAVVLRALARDPAKRFQTAADFEAALERAAPAASDREVAACVLSLNGESLQKRRVTLGEMVEGRRAPMDDGTRLRLPDAGERRTLPDVPVARRAASSDESTEAAATHDAPLRSSAPRGGVRLGTVVAVALGAVALTVAALLSVQRLRGAHDAAAIAVVTPATSAAAGAAPELRDGVAVSIRADDVIESVQAMGTREVDIEGKRARLVVAPWHGALDVDVTLAGGRKAHARVDESGAREVTIRPIAVTDLPAAPPPTSSGAPPPSAPSPPSRAAAPSPRPARSASPAPPSPSPPSELQSNPYGTP